MTAGRANFVNIFTINQGNINNIYNTNILYGYETNFHYFKKRTLVWVNLIWIQLKATQNFLNY